MHLLYTLSLLLALGLSQTVYAQQPFERYGVKVKVATLSNGQFPEFFANDSLRRIGSVVYNTRLHRVAYLLPPDSLVGHAKPDVTSRWMSPDPLAHEYMYVSPYVFVLNNPVCAVDPDGKRVYFVAGAGNDRDGWNYVRRWGQAFQNAGVDFRRFDDSHGQAGDIAFTAQYRNSGYEPVYQQTRGFANETSVREPTGEERPVQEGAIDRAASYYEQQLKDNPLKEGEQFNLAGYSYGSVVQAQAALKLANNGTVIDNLVLIGSPISSNSAFYKQISSNKNIHNVIRFDIPGDHLSNPKDVLEFIQGGFTNLGNDGHHFDAARPGEQASKLINTIVEYLKQ